MAISGVEWAREDWLKFPKISARRGELTPRDPLSPGEERKKKKMKKRAQKISRPGREEEAHHHKISGCEGASSSSYRANT